MVSLVHFKNGVLTGVTALLNCTFVKTLKTVKQWFSTVFLRVSLLVLSERSLVDSYGTLPLLLCTWPGYQGGGSGGGGTWGNGGWR